MPGRSKTILTQPAFLPGSAEAMERLGWGGLDVLLISGDAYIDHPASGAALLGRLLVSRGYKTGLISQPAWDDPDSLRLMGRPGLLLGITAGALDSMLAHYTAFRKKRRDDAYTPGGLAGRRPNRAALVYAQLARRAFPGLPVLLGGIEASLRRASHYDFWQDTLKRSLLLDSKADILVYGMAELSLLAILERLERAGPGAKPREVLKNIPGTAMAGRPDDLPTQAGLIELPSHEDILADPSKLIQATLLMEQQMHQGRDYAVQKSGERFVIMAPPQRNLSTEEMDQIYALPFSRQSPPGQEPVPALEMLKDSITSHRGCAGGCAFCTLALHQGRRIASRSPDSILAEARDMSVAGRKVISNVGGPSANMWAAQCKGPAGCVRSSCLTPRPCPHFVPNQAGYLELLRRIARLPDLKQVRLASGLRPDLALLEKQASLDLIKEFIGGQANLAPEHTSPHVLKLMRKPEFQVFEDFLALFKQACQEAGKELYVVPYLMSAHPGCTNEDMAGLRDWFRQRGWSPRQIQCFIPLPGTLSAAMFYAEADDKLNPLAVAKSDAERLAQHRIILPETGRPGSGKTSTRKNKSQSQNQNQSIKVKGASGGRGK